MRIETPWLVQHEGEGNNSWILYWWVEETDNLTKTPWACYQQLDKLYSGLKGKRIKLCFSDEPVRGAFKDNVYKCEWICMALVELFENNDYYEGDDIWWWVEIEV